MATIIVWSYVSTSASMILKSSGVRDGDRENGACNVKQISLPLRMLEMSKLWIRTIFSSDYPFVLFVA